MEKQDNKNRLKETEASIPEKLRGEILADMKPSDGCRKEQLEVEEEYKKWLESQKGKTDK